MRIILLVHGFPPELAGGTERHVAALAKALAGRGHDVTVVAGTMATAERCRLESEQIDGLTVVRVLRDDFHFERWDRLYHPVVSRLLEDLFASRTPDVVHVHHWLRLTADPVRLARRRGIPVIASLHDYTAICPTINRVLPDTTLCDASPETAPCAECVDLSRVADRAAVPTALGLRWNAFRNELNVANRLLALSESEATRFVDVLGAGSPPITAQPFCSNETLRPGPEPTRPLPLRVLTLGRVGHDKGQDLVLRALQESGVADRIELDVFGTCHEPDHAAELDALGHGLRWRRRGPYDLDDLRREPYHLAILPSRLPETHGLILDEAQMLGVPVYASDCGAYRERIGEGGRTFESGNSEALAALLRHAVTHPAELATLRANVPPPRRFDHLVDFLEKTYVDVIANPHPPPPDHFDLSARLEYEHRRGDDWERRAQRP
jgi:glycosyltransferase involved in cell wall biosynthesis